MGRQYTLVVMFQPHAWEQINGDTIPGTVETLANLLPVPVAIVHRGHQLVVLSYDTWKQRILRRQGGTV